jgi:uncharacterized protein YdeI (BOF family)
MRTSILLMTVASLAMTPVMAQESTGRNDQSTVEQGRELPMQGNRQRLEIGSADSEVVQAEVGEWVSVNGRIQDLYNDSFILDYGGGDVTVDMQGGYRDAFPLEIGENVTVSGRIDDGFFDRRSIEAESVHSERLAKRYMVDDSEMDEAFFEQPEERLAMDDEWLTVTGTIVSVDGDEMTLDVGTQTISVDLDRLDHELAVKSGDRVSVYGEMDDADFWEGREIVAQTVTPLG